MTEEDMDPGYFLCLFLCFARFAYLAQFHKLLELFSPPPPREK